MNLKEIKESRAEIEKKKKEEEDKKKEEQRKAEDPAFIEQQRRKAAQEGFKNVIKGEFDGQGSIEVQRLTQKKMAEFIGGKPITSKEEQRERKLKMTQYYKQENLSKRDLLEQFMTEFSKCVLVILRNEGKNLRDLFSIFTKETSGFLNQDEFFEACKFITSDFVDREFSYSFFNFFVTGYPRKMSFKIFSHIVYTGKKGNSIYIKLKHKFKQRNL